jgi:hypothetical protein
MREGKIRPEDTVMGVVARVTGSMPKTTFNGDGKYYKSWRLRENGQVERTNSSSQYKERIDCENIPAAILRRATELDIKIAAGRQCGPWHSHARTRW